MRLVRDALAVGMLAVTAAIAACSGPTALDGTGDYPNGGKFGNTANTGDIGSVRTSLTVNSATNAQLQSLDYTISGPPGTFGPSLVTIGDAQSIEWVAGDIAVGCGYTISVTATDTAGDVCSGTSTTFCVIANKVAAVGLTINCEVPTDAAIAANIGTGAISVVAGVTLTQQPAYSCPGISSFAINPAGLAPGELATVSVALTGNSAGTVSWTSSGCNGTGTLGGFLDPADGGADTTDDTVAFSCGSCNGNTLVTATAELDVVRLGQTATTNVCSGVSFTTMTASISCE